MKNQETYSLYYKLLDVIKTNGIKTEKTNRYGEYREIFLFDGWSLKVDTYNSVIEVRRFYKFQYTLGIDFGGFECYDERMLKFWYAHVCHLPRATR
jgi:hypothetical protein